MRLGSCSYRETKDMYGLVIEFLFLLLPPLHIRPGVPFFAEHVFLAVTCGEKVFKMYLSVYHELNARDALFLRLFTTTGRFTNFPTISDENARGKRTTSADSTTFSKNSKVNRDRPNRPFACRAIIVTFEFVK